MKSNKTFKFIILSAILIAIWTIFLSSCNTETNFSEIPEIKFKEHQLFKNSFGKDTSLNLIISFTDGDGDLGLEQEDTNAPFNAGSKYHFCMYIYYYEYVDSQWVEIVPEVGGIPIGDTIRFPYRFRNLTPSTRNKAIKGDITWTSNFIQPVKSNKIKFKIYIYDRALHKSNEVESPEIIYNN